MSVVDLFEEVRALGGVLIPRSPDRLRVEAPEPLPEDLMKRLRARKREILATLAPSKGVPHEEWEMLRRATLFRAQISESGVAPFMHLPEAEGRELREGECLSCGGPLPEGSRWRCPLCLAAALIALGEGLP